MYVKEGHVIYQRSHSAFSYVTPSSLDLRSIFKISYDWLHLTGITPSLNKNCKDSWNFLLYYAISISLPVSIDLNHRPALCEFSCLWVIVKPCLFRLEVLVISETDIRSICALEGIDTDGQSLERLLLSIGEKCQIKRLVTCIKKEDNGIQRRYSVMAYRGTAYTSCEKTQIVNEHIGGGDAYVACLIDLLAGGETDIVEVLDRCDVYTMMAQRVRGNFSLVDKQHLEEEYEALLCCPR